MDAAEADAEFDAMDANGGARIRGPSGIPRRWFRFR
jgi:hypothetical protein